GIAFEIRPNIKHNSPFFFFLNEEKSVLSHAILLKRRQAAKTSRGGTVCLRYLRLILQSQAMPRSFLDQVMHHQQELRQR
ncbi:hypothetical protein, partial [Streptococcus pneumoniae]|uniref:hypothetical protein n=1 Tax=Streptococcus pneumoniae TaxID=1313 RepID=UPI0022A93CBF